MIAWLTTRVRPAVELMRLPLVVTAISNTQAAYFLWVTQTQREWNPVAALTLLLMSGGLYSFGMVMNDVVDHRRDQYLHPNRPLVSGRIGMQEAYFIGTSLLILGLLGGVSFITLTRSYISLFFMAWTVLLVFFYNLTGKFVGAVGILTLGLIRFFHAAVPQPHLGVVWHPLLLMDHVVILSALCYALEGKHPRLSKAHWWGIGMGLLGLNLFLSGGVVLATWLRLSASRDFAEAIGLSRGLIWPLLAAAIFGAFAAAAVLSLREREGLSQRELLDRQRKTGRKLMFSGLLWLVIYDIAFALGFG
jgi:4-hydroxybenzoate polyprenyltransferase